MNAVVIGQGSIGQRHAILLNDLGLNVFTVSRHLPLGPTNFIDIPTAVSELHPDYVVVATATADHCSALRVLQKLQYGGKVLVEKPIFSKAEPAENFEQLKISIGYNLRFHPLLQHLKNALREQRICSVNAYVGQYLPTWRKDDYRNGYSATKEGGGGVLRDLSHELDYLLWLFGRWNSVTAVIGKYGDLQMSSEDTCSVLIRLEQCPIAMLELNCNDRTTQRWLNVITASHSYRLDFVNSTIQTDGTIETIPADRNATYLAMHKSVLHGNAPAPCTLSEGLNIMGLIGAIEDANQKRIWVSQ